MNFGGTVKYGLLVMAYIAQNSKNGLVTTSTVAREYSVPETYLTKVMQFLVKADILTSKRGPRGGHTLARPAKEISMLEIIEAMEGPLELKMEMPEFTKYAPYIVDMETIFKDATAKTKGI